MALNLGQMLRDRRFQLAAGAAGVVGAAVFVMRKKSGASGSSGGDDAATVSAGAGTSGTSYSGTGVFDSTGNDIASWLGDYSGSLQNQLNDYAAQLKTSTDELDTKLNAKTGDLGTQLAKLQTTVDAIAKAQKPAPKPPIKPAPKPKPPSKPAPKPAAQYVTATAFTTHNPAWNSTLSGIAAHQHTTVGNLLKLNPSIKNPSVIRKGQKIRVR